jgi:hypothetical protein
MEVDWHEDEANGAGDSSDDEEGDSSADGEVGGQITKSGEVYIWSSAISCNMWKILEITVYCIHIH